MKYYEKKGHFWLGLLLTVVGIGVGCMYWNDIAAHMKSLKKGTPVQATIMEIECTANGSSYVYTAQAEYKSPITETRVMDTLGGYETWMDGCASLYEG